MNQHAAYRQGIKCAQQDLGLSDEQGMSKYYPLMAGLAAAGVSGPLIYRAMRKIAPSGDVALDALRAKARDVYTRAIPTKAPSSYLAKLRDKLLYTGGDDVAYTDYDAPAATKKVKGMVRYSEPSDAAHVQGDVATGAAPDTADVLKRIQDNKWHEYEFFNKHAPEAFGKSENIKDVLAGLGHTAIPADPAAQSAMLDQLQNTLRTRYGQGFLLKETGGLQSGGIFPNDKTHFNSMVEGYRKAGIEPKFNEGLKNLHANYGGDIGKLISEFRDDPHYEGRVLEQLLRSPENVMVQERLPLLEPKGLLRKTIPEKLGLTPNYEARVHVENGKVVPALTSARYDPLMELANRDLLRGSDTFAQGIVDKLPPEHRNMSFAMDVHPLKDGTFKLMESNPGGQSGFLYPDVEPLSGPRLRKAHMGNYAKPISAITAAGGALAAGGLGAGIGTGVSKLAPSAPTTPKEKPSGPSLLPTHRQSRYPARG